jgi:phosphoribosylanthranilate isomerase
LGVAGDIAAAVAGTPLVGVFVDLPRQRVERVADALGLAALQFHGDEDPSYCAGWDRRVIKAIRPRPGEDASALAKEYATDYLLLDAWVPGTRGTGVPVDVEAARGLDAGRLFVAGGLRPGRLPRSSSGCGRSRSTSPRCRGDPERKSCQAEAFIRRAKAA